MSQEEAIVFYRQSSRASLRDSERNQSGWQRCIIYENRHSPGYLGFGGAMNFCKLSDGRVVLTNDLWDEVRGENRGWVSAVPRGALIGYKLSTRVCQPVTKAGTRALARLVISRANTLKIP